MNNRRLDITTASVLGAATAVAYTVGIGRTLDYDSSVSVGNFIATHDLLSPLRHQIVFNNHPWFSVAEHLVFLVGGRSEVALRVLPILCGAATAGVTGGWVAACRGRERGFAAALLVATNPMHFELSRSVRGYSLMTLGVVVSTWVLLHPNQTWRLKVIYSIALGVAVGTHLYAAVAATAHIAYLLHRRRVNRRWAVGLAAAGAIGVAPYMLLLRSMIRDGAARSRDLQPAFPLEAARELLGRQSVAVLVLAVLLGVAFVRRDAAPDSASVAVVGGLVAAVWLLVRPQDLYPRFLLPLVVAVAAGAVHAGRSRWVVPIAAGVAAIIMGSTDLVSARDDPFPIRKAASVASQLQARGESVCALNFFGEAFNGYGLFPRRVDLSEDLKRCDVVLSFEKNDPSDLVDVTRREFPAFRTFAGRFPITIRSRHALPLPEPLAIAQ